MHILPKNTSFKYEENHSQFSVYMNTRATSRMVKDLGEVRSMQEVVKDVNKLGITVGNAKISEYPSVIAALQRTSENLAELDTSIHGILTQYTSSSSSGGLSLKGLRGPVVWHIPELGKMVKYDDAQSQLKIQRKITKQLVRLLAQQARESKVANSTYKTDIPAVARILDMVTIPLIAVEGRCADIMVTHNIGGDHDSRVFAAVFSFAALTYTVRATRRITYSVKDLLARGSRGKLERLADKLPEKDEIAEAVRV